MSDIDKPGNDVSASTQTDYQSSTATTAYGSASDVPPGLNWGGFLLPFWWSVFHRAWLWLGVSICIFVATWVAKSSVPALSHSADYFGFFTGLIHNGTRMGIGGDYLSFFAGLIPRIVLLKKGNAIGWASRRFDSVDQFNNVQKAWTRWGLVIDVAVLAIMVMLFGLTIAAIVRGMLSH
jgi:hypothetical protein